MVFIYREHYASGRYQLTQCCRSNTKEPRFVRMQRRRSQTEGRISILQRGFLGRPMRAKGFAHRELAVDWGVLTHNLWMLARLKREKKEPLRQAA